MYLLTLTFALGYLSGQLPIPIQALAATVLICLLSTSRIVSPTTPPADEHYDKNLDITPLTLKAIYDSQKVETKRDEVKADQSPTRGRTPRQHKQDAGRTVSYENLTMQQYDRSHQVTQVPCDNREAPSPRELELSLSQSQSTSSLASTFALTAPHCETRNTETGNTKPNPPQTFGCDPELSTHETTKKPGMDQVSTKLHRSKSVVCAGMEHHHGHAADDGQGNNRPVYSRSLENVRPQTIEARLTGVTNEDVLAQARVDVSQAAPRSDDTGIQQRSSLSSCSSEEIEVSQQSTDITFPGLDEEHDKQAHETKDDEVTETTDDMKSINDKDGGRNNNIGEFNMSDLLKTSNRLLEDGRQLLADGMRQPRRASTSVAGDEEAGEFSHNGPQSQLRTPDDREGWYAHDN
ncbi:hypothetical protein VPNG_10249 [Cytospora leucostoma]|uniref:Uncharacterized protein n=1 Tax=Cytospora leucostoma TaxID=1230097 RepID=A0A423VFS6_9PEZI|nr:hypothetical protein VPNG_10249 [Cytospora leucostoma]